MAMPILKMVRTDGKPGEVRVYERDVAAYQASGWVLADPEELLASLKRKPDLKPGQPATPDAFDWAAEDDTP